MEDTVKLDVRQFGLLLTKFSELTESNILVAATNIAQDQGIDLDNAIAIAIAQFQAIGEQRRRR